MSRIPFERVEWVTFAFLSSTFLLTLTGVPLYIWHFGLDWFQVILFLLMYCATGLSITLGYHRLFAHRAFQAKWPIRLFTLVFGAAAFENSALDWASDHRRHHKHTDTDDDPYDASKGLFWSHLGWMLFKLKPLPPYDNVADLAKDPLVRWQHKHWHLIGFVVAFILPTAIGYAWGGWQCALGAFLIGGVARVVAVQHSTFCINSLCHYLGSQPYSSRCSAKDSWLMALVTFGEGYHNFHHEFPSDYRNGVRPWHFDPTKWTIWILSKLGLTEGLRRIPQKKIEAAVQAEKQKLAPPPEDEDNEILPVAIMTQLGQFSREK